MTKLEKTIHGLECCLNTGNFEECIENCPYFSKKFGVGICSENMMRDALTLLKEQKPRIMKLNEIKDGEHYWLSTGKEFLARPVICVCREDNTQKSYIIFRWQFGELSLEAENCGKTWFCWTSQPTDEQQEAIPWIY